MKRTASIGVFLLPLLLPAQEIIPAYPVGGEKQARAFIDEEVIYPEDALKKGIEGEVTFAFVVQEQGIVKDVKVNDQVDPMLKKEALRIFRLINWQPAEYRGKAVESRVEFTIPFSIRKYKKAVRNRGYVNTSLPTIPIDSSGRIFQYKMTDVQPSPVFDKDMNLQKFMATHFLYPEEALRRNITGVVKLNFIVEPHGRISNVKTLDHVGAGCSEEAIRLVKLLRWSPGMKDGKAVRVSLTMPITFGLSSEGGYNVAPASGQTTFQ